MPRKPKFQHPLRGVRKAISKSQQQFARMFGVSGSYIQAIELRQRKLSDDLADAIMLRLGVNAKSLKRGRGMPQSLIGSGKAEFMLWHGPSGDRREMDKLIVKYAKLTKLTDPYERFRSSVEFWEKEIVPRWEFWQAHTALNDKLEILFEAAQREKKHFLLAMRLSRWIENSVSEFRLKTTINAVRAIPDRYLDGTLRPKPDWKPFMKTLSESFRLLPPQKKQRCRRKKR